METAKVVLLWIEGEFYGVFGQSHGARQIVYNKTNHQLDITPRYQMEDRVVTRSELEDLVEGEVPSYLFDDIVSGDHVGVIIGQ